MNNETDNVELRTKVAMLEDLTKKLESKVDAQNYELI